MKGSSPRIVAVVVALAVVAYCRVVRPWHLHWGAGAAEVGRSMPGDALIPRPAVSATRGITIEAPVEEVWPWLVQMGGYTRAGWYAYDRFDNAGVPSADRIIPGLQELHVGDTLLTSPTEGFVVRAIDPGASIVLEIERRGSRITSVPVLTALQGGRTRLVFRMRAAFRLRHVPFAVAFDLGDFVFMRKLMLGIKHRAERTHAALQEARTQSDPAPNGGALG